MIAQKNKISAEKMERQNREVQVEEAEGGRASTKEAELPDQQIKAVIYGQCVGDAIGLLTEFLTKKDAKKYYKKKKLEYQHKIPDFHRSRWQIGDWTDDSDQMLLILTSLLDKQGQVCVQDFAQKMLDWKAHGFPELGDLGGMGIGATTLAVLRDKTFVTDPHKNSGCNVAPNGGVMRTSVVGTNCWWDTEHVVKNALAFVKCTHHDPRCQASAVAVSVCISLMLQHNPQHMETSTGSYNVGKLIKDSFDHASQCLETEEQKNLLWEYMNYTKVKDLKLAEPGKIGFTYKSMGAGFWALKQDNFRKAIQKITMEGGDADSNACVAGAMLACKLGFDAIPDTWIAGLQHKDWLEQKISRYLLLQKEMLSNFSSGYKLMKEESRVENFAVCNEKGDNKTD